MNYLKLTQYLVSVNKELVEKTAIKDCHCVGLNSFVINEKPRIRLFIADDNCELYGTFNPGSPTIPIHAHKYDDMFAVLSGEVIHHIYSHENPRTLSSWSPLFNEYRYARIPDKERLPELVKHDVPLYWTTILNGNATLSAHTLHTVELRPPAMWLIFETFEDKDFVQRCYHTDLKPGGKLYLPFKGAIGYIENKLK